MLYNDSRSSGKHKMRNTYKSFSIMTKQVTIEII